MEYLVTVEMRHLQAADPSLANELVQKPGDLLPIVSS